MCDEDSRGERLYNRQPEAYRMSRKKAPLTDIQLLTPLRSEKSGGVMLTASDSRNNGFAKAFRVLGGPEISIHALDRSEAKVASWPEIHDDRAVTICAGKVYGATLVSVGQ